MKRPRPRPKNKPRTEPKRAVDTTHVTHGVAMGSRFRLHTPTSRTRLFCSRCKLPLGTCEARAKWDQQKKRWYLVTVNVNTYSEDCSCGEVRPDGDYEVEYSF